jgi:hypothetical protein
MKLAKSTTFSPEKILSFAIESLLTRRTQQVFSPPVEAGHTFLEEGGRALFLVVGRGAEAEERSLEQQAFALARLNPFICRLDSELDGYGSVGGDLFQDCFGAGDEI